MLIGPVSEVLMIVPSNQLLDYQVQQLTLPPPPPPPFPPPLPACLHASSSTRQASLKCTHPHLSRAPDFYQNTYITGQNK